MQTKLLSEIIKEIAGVPAVGILDILNEKRDVNEFLIAKKLKLTINQTRNIFYKLSNFGLVSFTRKKDKRKGWYTYFWTLNTIKTLELLEERLNKEIENLRYHLKNRETKRFYFCTTCKVEVGEENALIHNFTCSECGQVYELSETKKIIEDIQNKTAKLERQKHDILEELTKLRGEESKKREKKQKRDNVKKAKERKVKREKAKKEREKEKKKVEKGKKQKKK